MVYPFLYIFISQHYLRASHIYSLVQRYFLHRFCYSSIRINNSAEGSDFRLSRISGKKLTTSKYAAYVVLSFKLDIVKKPQKRLPTRPMDVAPLEIKLASKHNVDDLLEILFFEAEKYGFEIEKLSGKFCILAK